MNTLTKYLLCAKKNRPLFFNEICETNNIFGINRIAFESELDRLDKEQSIEKVE